MLSSIDFLKYAYKKNREFHKHLSSIYEYIGKGSFSSVYYDKKSNRVLKVFNLNVIKHRKHSLTISEEAEELFYQVCSPVLGNNKETEEALLQYIFKTNYDWGMYCLIHADKYKHLPKVYSVKIFPEFYSYVVETELLNTSHSLNDTSIGKFVSGFCKNLCEMFQCNEINIRDAVQDNLKGISQKKIQEHSKSIDFEEMQELVSILSSDFKDFLPDLHVGNILFRVDGDQKTMILNDPFY